MRLVSGATGERDALVARLAVAGCVAADEEADELVAAAAGDAEMLERLVARRVVGEPLAWVTGTVQFLGHRVRVHPGVYVPRWQTEMLAARAVELLPEGGLAADLCTGAGAIAIAMARARPGARVVATDLDPAACRCARANAIAGAHAGGSVGAVVVLAGHLADPVPAELHGLFDVVVAVVPYVPSEEIPYLPRDVREHEPLRALDGGPGGVRLLEQAVWAGAGLLRNGGSLLLELGGDQHRAMLPVLQAAGYGPPRVLVDDDGDVRAVEARYR